YVTPLVRKLAAEHGIDLGTVSGTGVGGRIRKQDILDAAARQRGPAGQAQVTAPAAAPAQPAPAPAPAAYEAAAPAAAPAAPSAQPAAPALPTQAPFKSAAPAAAEPAKARPSIVPSSLRGKTERMSRARQVIAQRMVESLQTSAQL